MRIVRLQPPPPQVPRLPVDLLPPLRAELILLVVVVVAQDGEDGDGEGVVEGVGDEGHGVQDLGGGEVGVGGVGGVVAGKEKGVQR